MVVDLKKLTDSLRQSSPEEDLRQDLERIIHARKREIEETLASGKSYWLRVPDGRQVRISPLAAEAGKSAELAANSAH
jgi:hypothetical protein